MSLNHCDTKASGELRERLRSARGVFVLTGAGVSAESGVPTFRGGGGASVWKGMPLDVISSVEMVERDLGAVWEWFRYRFGLLESCAPNPAHAALAGWQDRFERFTLATQNIDGLHALAGSRDVLELHGSIRKARCLDCHNSEEIERSLRSEGVPACLMCGGGMRPDVVLFGELLPVEVFEKASRGAATCDVCFIVGTSGIVYPAAGLPLLAERSGAYIVEVNPEPTPLSELCDEVYRGRAGDVLPLLGF